MTEENEETGIYMIENREFKTYLAFQKRKSLGFRAEWINF
jgi:hypothetical protein